MARPDAGDENNGSNSHSRTLRTLRERLRLQNLSPPPDETIEEGYHLFNNFLHEEFSRQDLMQEINGYNIPVELPSHTTIPFASPQIQIGTSYYGGGASNGHASQQFDGFASTSQMQLSAAPVDPYTYRQVGKSIRALADEFSKSEQGRKVVAFADEVDLDKLDADAFTELMKGVFHDGNFNRNTIIAVFVFCSSLLIKALREKALSILKSIIKWCFEFIRDKVCKVVQEQGGWNAMLSGMADNLFKMSLTASLAVLFSLSLFYLWKK